MTSVINNPPPNIQQPLSVPPTEQTSIKTEPSIALQAQLNRPNPKVDIIATK